MGTGNGDRCEISVGQVLADVGKYPGCQGISQRRSGRLLFAGGGHDERSDELGRGCAHLAGCRAGRNEVGVGSEGKKVGAHKLEEGAGRQVAACLTREFNRDPDVLERDLNRRGGTPRHEFIPSDGIDQDDVAGHQVLVAVRLN